MAACALQSAPVLGKSLAFSSLNTFCRREKRPIIPSSTCIQGRRRYHTTASLSKSSAPEPLDRKQTEKSPLRPAHTDAPKGRFDGYGAHDSPVPFTTRKDATFVSFDFKKDIPLRTILNFTDASQGFGTFNGVTFKGRLILPNIYKAYNNKPHLIDAPWIEAAASVPGCRFAAFTMEVTSQEDVASMIDVVSPLIEWLDVSGPDAFGDLYLL